MLLRFTNSDLIFFGEVVYVFLSIGVLNIGSGVDYLQALLFHRLGRSWRKPSQKVWLVMLPKDMFNLLIYFPNKISIKPNLLLLTAIG